MNPFGLLIVFIALAALAIAGFGYLIWTADRDTRRKDLSTFLSSFAVTAIVLSVGFISILLQQANQAESVRQQQVNAAKQREIELSAQIKARLNYALAQQKFELMVLREMLGGLKEIDDGCSKAKDDAERLAHFNKAKSDFDRDRDIGAIKKILERLFGGSGLQRDPINRLLRETILASRIDQELTAEMMDLELQLQVKGPVVIEQRTDGSLFLDQGQFCNRASDIDYESKRISASVRLLQLYTCIIQTLADDAASSVTKSRAALVSINSARRSRPEQWETQLRDGLVKILGADFEKCIKFADLKFDELPGN
jgi:hypothetical protein